MLAVRSQIRQSPEETTEVPVDATDDEWYCPYCKISRGAAYAGAIAIFVTAVAWAAFYDTTDEYEYNFDRRRNVITCDVFSSRR